jgi:tetratricopeptide (TPR) repeat protein
MPAPAALPLMPALPELQPLATVSEEAAEPAAPADAAAEDLLTTDLALPLERPAAVVVAEVDGQRFVGDAAAPLAAADPEDRGLQTSLAESQLRAGRPADARATLEKLLPKMHEPQAKAKTHLLLSETLVALKLGKEAKVQAEEAQRLQPEGRINAQARLANGRALLAQERYDDAARSFMAVALLYDEKDLTPLALLLAEQAYASAGNTAEAAQARQERERRYPDFQPPASS